MYTVNNYAKDSIKVTYTVYQNFLVYCISCHFDYREVLEGMLIQWNLECLYTCHILNLVQCTLNILC